MADLLTTVGNTQTPPSGIETYSLAVTSGILYVNTIRDPAGTTLGISSNFVATNQALPPSLLVPLNVTTGTLAAGQASGAQIVYLKSSNATPGSQAMRTPAQVLADTPGLAVGTSYTLRVINTGAGTFTLATDSGSGFTITGTATVAQNVFRDYVVKIVTGTTGTIDEVGNGTYG